MKPQIAPAQGFNGEDVLILEYCDGSTLYDLYAREHPKATFTHKGAMVSFVHSKNCNVRVCMTKFHLGFDMACRRYCFQYSASLKVIYERPVLRTLFVCPNSIDFPT